MNIRNVQAVIGFVLFFFFAACAWAEEWIPYTTTAIGSMYYDKSSIKKTNHDIVIVQTKNVLNDEGKKYTFSMLESAGKAPESPFVLSHAMVLFESDCVNEKMKDYSTIIYDEKGTIIYASAQGNTGEWKSIRPNSVAERLKNIVCSEMAARGDVGVARNATPVAPKEAVVAPRVAAPDAPDRKIAQVSSKPDDVKSFQEEAIWNLINQWLASWQSGDMANYRNCYAPDFKSKEKNLNDWITHKENIKKKSKDITIGIENLRIFAQDTKATAVFHQSYSSSLLKDTGKKTLELIKIDGEWKISREMM